MRLCKLFLALRELQKLKLRTAELIITKHHLKFLFFEKKNTATLASFDLS